MYSPKLRPPMSISNKAGEDSTLFSTRRCLLAWAFIRLIVSLLWTGLLILVTVVTIIHYYDKDAENERDRLLFEVPAIVVQMVEIGMLVTFIVAGFKKSAKLYDVYYRYCILTLMLYIGAVAISFFVEYKHSHFLLENYITYHFVDFVYLFGIPDALVFGSLAVIDICLEILLLRLIKKLILKYSYNEDPKTTTV
ncbi:uncharacterized protein LOC118267545 [Spodoptera frugiperda]|uniref:Uncharacterized protein LOC118267545 n=1 Tax=Spodoptera frugiperda TaxID=7108 RepID=A0A9R0EV75_SPOFR|nr:uncharacterized protein LOC118267545 [Spodoptera frugiperda]XP_050550543.1 uncharacterized protein LOC118267545 [Spodoptera frugiperda]